MFFWPVRGMPWEFSKKWCLLSFSLISALFFTVLHLVFFTLLIVSSLEEHSVWPLFYLYLLLNNLSDSTVKLQQLLEEVFVLQLLQEVGTHILQTFVMRMCLYRIHKIVVSGRSNLVSIWLLILYHLLHVKSNVFWC